MDQRTGAFTNALCECLRRSHHNTSILSLHKDICIYLDENGYSQQPILSSTVEVPRHMFFKEVRKGGWVPISQDPLIAKISLPSSRLTHQYVREPVAEIDIIKKIRDEDESVIRGLLPIISSGFSVSTGSSSEISSFSSLCRHFYKRGLR